MTESGKRMPLDAEPHPEGNVLMVAGGSGPVARVLSASAAATTSGALFRSHFVTCPDAGKWRRDGQ